MGAAEHTHTAIDRLHDRRRILLSADLITDYYLWPHGTEQHIDPFGFGTAI